MTRLLIGIAAIAAGYLLAGLAGRRRRSRGRGAGLVPLAAGIILVYAGAWVLIGVLYATMLLGLAGMTAARRASRRRGVTWGRPAAVGCCLVALAAALLRIGLHLAPDDSATVAVEQHRQTELALVAAGLGHYLARRFSGEKCLVIMPPGGDPRLQQWLEALRAGAGSGQEIEEWTPSVTAPDQGASVISELAAMGVDFSAEAVDRAVREHGDCGVVVFFTAAPTDLARSALMQPAARGPAVVLFEFRFRVPGLRQLIASGAVTHAIRLHPSFPVPAELPKDAWGYFQKRCIVVTPENVAAMSSAFAGLFD